MKKIMVFVMTIVLIFSTSILSHASSTPIRNTPQSSQSQAVQYLKDKNAEQELIDLVPFIYEYCEEVGVEPTLVIAQISLETNFFRSSLCKTHKNTSGMKKTSNTYIKFDTYKDAIKAEIDHLNLYAGYPEDSKSWLKGWCTTVEQLAGTWAEDPKYSVKLLSIMEDIQEYPNCEFYEEPTEENKKEDIKINKPINESNKKENKGIDIINNILNRNKEHSKGFNMIMDILGK